MHEILRIPGQLWDLWRLPTRHLKKQKHKYGPHWRQYLIYYPAPQNRPTRHQVIVYLHGGAWSSGMPEMFHGNANTFLEQGFAVFSLSHRHLPFFRFQHLKEDMSLAMQKIVQLMKREGIQNKKILLSGMSSGAHLLAILLYDRAGLQALNLKQQQFSGLILCGAPMDLNQMRASVPLRQLAGQRSGELFHRANPINYIRADESTPVLCIHGTNDGLVEYKSIQSYINKMKTIRPGLVEFHSIEGGTHMDAACWATDQQVKKLLVDFALKLEREIVKTPGTTA